MKIRVNNKNNLEFCRPKNTDQKNVEVSNILMETEKSMLKMSQKHYFCKFKQKMHQKP